MQLSPPPDPQLWTQPFHEEEAEKMLADRGEIIVFAPASNWPPKTWPVDSWKTLGEKLLSPQGLFPGATLLLMGARHERSILEAVAHGVGEKKCILGAGDVHLLTLYACLKRARVFVGNDSGLMHLAAASGVPTVGLFGPTPSRQYRPWGKRTAVAHCPEAQVLLKERAFRNPQESVMGKLMPEVVLEKIAGLL
jgi:ADP-heptose:LPS heptosyltransferase